MSGEVKEKKSFFSAIKSRFPTKKRKNKYRVGYEDLITDSCSLPSIAEESQLIVVEDMVPGELGQYDDCVVESEGVDSAYYSSSLFEEGELRVIEQSYAGKQIFESVGDEEINSSNKTNISGIMTKTKGGHALGSVESDIISVSDYSEGEVCSTICSEEADLYRREYCNDGDTDGESSDNPEIYSPENVAPGTTLSDIPLLQFSDNNAATRSENNGNGTDPKNHEFDFPTQDHVQSDVEQMTFVRDGIKDIFEDDITLDPGDLVSALRSDRELGPLYYENVRIKTPPLDRAISKNIQEEIQTSDYNIFEKARQASPIDSEYESLSSEEDFTKDSESLLLVDEIDAYNLNRGKSPSGLMCKEKYIDTSVTVFPGDTNTDTSNFVSQMFKTSSLFSKQTYDHNQGISDCSSGQKQDVEVASSSTLSSDFEEIISKHADNSEEANKDTLPLDDKYADTWSLYTDTSTLRRSRCSNASSISSLETVVANRSAGSSSDEYYGSYDGSDEDNGSEVSERTSFHRQIPWAEEEFIELPAAIKALWTEDAELFGIVKFLSKWGKYNVIVEGTLDIDDFWEDHIYFQSSKGKSIEQGDESLSDTSPEPQSAGQKGWSKEADSDEEDNDGVLGTADCQIVDRLFTMYQQRKLLQFNALQQKSLYCSPCQSFHIIEII